MYRRLGIMSADNHSATQRSQESWLAQLKAGELIEFAEVPSDRAETSEEREARTLPAELFTRLLENEQRSVTAPLRVCRAIISGTLNFENATFKDYVAFNQCEFTGEVNFRFATFERTAAFYYSLFLAKVIFINANAMDNLGFGGSEFRTNVDFIGVRVARHLAFASYKQSKPTLFEGTFSLYFANVTGQVSFTGAAFRRKASFQDMRVGHNVSFDCDERGNQPTFGDLCDFSRARVGGSIEFEGVEFLSEFRFMDVNVEGLALFRSGPDGKRTRFSKEANFLRTTFNGNCLFEGVQFAGEADFAGMRANANIAFNQDQHHSPTTFEAVAKFVLCRVAQRITFGAVCNEKVVFAHAQLGSALFGDQGTIFSGWFDFNGVQVTNVAHFEGVQFRRGATFANATIGNDVSFGRDQTGLKTMFGGEALFIGTHVGGEFSIASADFCALACFAGMRVDGKAEFGDVTGGSRTRFQGDAQFLSVHIKGPAWFYGVAFNGAAMFQRIQFAQDTFFVPDNRGNRVSFAGEANFYTAEFNGPTYFQQTLFLSRAIFDDAQFRHPVWFGQTHFGSLHEERDQAAHSLRFRGTYFERGADFDSAEFRADVDFTSAKILRDLNFVGVQFVSEACFRDVQAQNVSFARQLNTRELHKPRFWLKGSDLIAERAIFNRAVDMRGFTYEQMRADLKPLLLKMTLAPFDRQPYTQLETILRKGGSDNEAEFVYLARRKQERYQKFRIRTIHAWVIDWLYKLTANYGVRPLRLIAYAVVVIALGAAGFSQPGALRPKEAGLTVSHIRPVTPIIALSTAKWRRGFQVSMRYFLPVDCPLGADWIPSSTGSMQLSFAGVRFDLPFAPAWYAAFLRIVGSVLIGLGVAAITGVLRRIAPH